MKAGVAEAAVRPAQDFSMFHKLAWAGTRQMDESSMVLARKRKKLINSIFRPHL